jgi:tRNA1(Val) A37 N6-methylase TrmN6
VTLRHLDPQARSIEVLDPACGDGALLRAVYDAMPGQRRSRLALIGFEQEAPALAEAARLLADCRVQSVQLQALDFLALNGIASPSLERPGQVPLDGRRPACERKFDAVIANPPYVRTQVLGAKKAQELAARFGLTGRVDLYQAFVRAMAGVLKPGGILGLLASNRFLTVKSGATLRRFLREEFQLEEIYDLGDTRLFEAAVLPVVLVARKQPPVAERRSTIDRVYRCRTRATPAPADDRRVSILDAMLDRDTEGVVRTAQGLYRIERGTLGPSLGDETWTLLTPEYERWLATLRANRRHTFDDLGVVRVGIKTCADKIFIRDDWDSLPPGQRPEEALLKPLITHFTANRWHAADPSGAARVLYPHIMADGRREPIGLEKYPRAGAYLRLHRGRLEARRYLIEAGRKWYEIWVPHHPADWQKRKLVFPDIAEAPRFFVDDSGAIVNGDCYWITLREGIQADWLLLMLAVANSSLITKYYDIAFHNKLYAGRRRFMTQYVKTFPLPELDSHGGRRIVDLTRRLLKGPIDGETEAELDGLVWRAFGLPRES